MLKTRLDCYIRFRRATGLQFDQQSSIITRFVDFTTKNSCQYICTQQVLEWMAKAPSVKTKQRWFRTLRHFSLWLHSEDPRHQVLPPDAVGRFVRIRRPPYIFAPDEIAKIIEAASQLKTQETFSSVMYPVLFGLMAATGMRVSEALKLRFSDITPDGLLIRKTKFRKSRIIPLHPTTQKAIAIYLEKRRKHKSATDAVFVCKTGNPPGRSTATRVFQSLIRSLGIKKKPGHLGPRLHDLRHSFAARSLEQSNDDPETISKKIAALSTYLGHSCISDTYWYLEATPVVLSLIASKAEQMYEAHK
jgi:integrase